MSSKAQQAVRKVSVDVGVAKLKPAEMVALQRTVHAKASSSPQYQAATDIVAADTAWTAAGNAVDSGETQINTLRSQLETAEVAQAQSLVTFRIAAADYANAVESHAQGNPSFVAEMGLTLRGAPQRQTAAQTPTGVQIATPRNGSGPRLRWEVVGTGPSVVQSTTDLTGASGWTQVAIVRGQSLKLSPPPAATTLYRVAVVFKGQPGPWSMTAKYEHS